MGLVWYCPSQCPRGPSHRLAQSPAMLLMVSSHLHSPLLHAMLASLLSANADAIDNDNDNETDNDNDNGNDNDNCK